MTPRQTRYQKTALEISRLISAFVLHVVNRFMITFYWI